MNGLLSEEDFDFVKKGQDEKSVKGTVRRKIKALPNMMELFRDGLQAEEGFRKNRVIYSFATADGNCTLGFTESGKARPKSLIRGNELKNPKPVELVLRKKSGAELFDEIVIGNRNVLDKYRKQIDRMVTEDLIVKFWRKDMKYITATADMVNAIYNVLHTAIKTIYPKYYPKEVVDFFCQHHNKEHILDGIESGNMGVLVDENVIVGTGCYNDNHITGVYVLPSYQKQGCGSQIMNCLENQISQKHDIAVLDASLPAACLYEHRGYKTVGHGICELENDVKLVYEIMEKKF